MKVKCPRCNTELYPDSVKCFACGYIIKEQLSDSISLDSTGLVPGSRVIHIGNPICPKCFAALYPDSIKCFSCGSVLSNDKVYIDDYLRKYIAIRKSLAIPESAVVITYRDSSNACPIKFDVMDYPLLAWKDMDFVSFFPLLSEKIPGELLEMYEEYPDIYAKYARIINNVIEPFAVSKIENNSNPFAIPVAKIDYFERTGEIIHENRISGGGGGGVSIVGALVGAAIAGGTGAIIGSRKGVKPVTSELVTHDARETHLLFNDQYDGKHTLSFGSDAYDVFKGLIPEKEYNFVMASRFTDPMKESHQARPVLSIVDQIREFGKLKDEGLITEDEFQLKKKQLLGL